VLLTPEDLAHNRAEVWRVVGTGVLDFSTARTLFWALQLAETGLRSEYNHLLRETRVRSDKSNQIYQVPITSFFTRTYPQNPTQVIENKDQKRKGSKAQIALSVSERLSAASRPGGPKYQSPAASAMEVSKENLSPGRDNT
jgi:hypothetical protein